MIKRDCLSVLILVGHLFLSEAHAGSDSRHSLAPSLGYTSIVYQETFKTDYVARVLTAKLQYQFRLTPSWHVGASSYGTAFTLSSNLPENSVRFVGLNLRLGYARPAKPSSWSFGILGGWYYNTMLVQDNSFGVRNLSGPQFFPTVKRQFGPRSFASAYLKFSPTLNDLKLMPLEDRELGAGVAWTQAVGKSRQVSISFDASNLRENFEPIQVNLTTYSLSLGVGL